MKAQVVAYTSYNIQILELHWNTHTHTVSSSETTFKSDALIKVLIPPRIISVCKTVETWTKR